MVVTSYSYIYISHQINLNTRYSKSILYFLFEVLSRHNCQVRKYFRQSCMIMHNSRNPVLSFSTLFYLFYQGSLKNVIFSNVNKIKFYHSRTNTCICKCLINTYFLQTTEAESDTYIVVSKSLIYLEFHSRVDDLLGHLY